MNFKKTLALSLLSSSLLFTGASFAKPVDNKAPHVRVYKNQTASANRMLLSITLESHIAVKNVTDHNLTVNSNGALIVLAHGDRADFYYDNFPIGPQAITIISDDGTVIYNDYEADQTLINVYPLGSGYWVNVSGL